MWQLAMAARNGRGGGPAVSVPVAGMLRRRADHLPTRWLLLLLLSGAKGQAAQALLDAALRAARATAV